MRSSFLDLYRGIKNESNTDNTEVNEPTLERISPRFDTPSKYDRSYFTKPIVDTVPIDRNGCIIKETKEERITRLLGAGRSVSEITHILSLDELIVTARPENVESMVSIIVKNALKDRIVKMIPPHRIYVETNCGMLDILLYKKERSEIEIVNDLNSDLVNFWRYVIAFPKEITDTINKLPISEEIQLDFAEHYNELSPFWKAVAFYYKQQQREYYYINEDILTKIALRLKYVDIRHNTNIIEQCNKGSNVFFFIYDKLQVNVDRIHELGNKFLIQTVPSNSNFYARYNQLLVDVYYEERQRSFNTLIVTNYAVPNE